MELHETILAALMDIAAKRPLIHHITNYVVMNETANATLAIGASPVMAHALEEVEEMASAASALVLNIGTLTPDLVESMLVAGRAAAAKGIPIVLDPVGAGATGLRTRATQRLLENLPISIIRCNRAEAAAIIGLECAIKGVDAVDVVDDAEHISAALSRSHSCVAALTGPIDTVCDGHRTARISHGHPMMATVTGTGCMATTMTAVFAAVIDDHFTAATAALAFYGMAGEAAAIETEGLPGSYHVALYDAIAYLAASGINDAKVELTDVSV